jgi:Txe/YoeB family toxin of toxin-antitoxin system
VSWRLVYTKQTQKDAKNLAAAGLKAKARSLLAILEQNPFQTPPPYEKLVGDLAGAYSRASTSSTASSIRSLRTRRPSRC